MTLYLNPDDLNVAPDAPKYPPTTWILLGAGAVLMGLSLFSLVHELKLLNVARSVHAELLKNLQRDEAEQRKLVAHQNNAEVLERATTVVQIQHLVNKSWDGIFNALEVASHSVHVGVSILSLLPVKADSESARFDIIALAANAPVMLAYVEALKRDVRVTLAELTSQQPDEKVGPTVVRFYISVILDPKVQVKRSPGEAAASSSSTNLPQENSRSIGVNARPSRK